MWGTIIGDIAGSVYEMPVDGAASIKTKDFPFWGTGCRFTDDTVTTVAVGQALMESRMKGQAVTPLLCRYLRYWCRRFPGVGYGPRFIHWYESDDMGPYGSWANGAAMRVAPAGWLADTLAEAQYLAELSAVVTHNTEEAIQGAVAVSSAIYLARAGIRRDDIRVYLQDHFYPLDRSLNEIRRDYGFTSRTSRSVPEAIEAFLESSDYEDAVRNAISLGGDTDTQAAIAGSLAEAYYGIPERMCQKATSYLPADIHQQVERLYAYIHNRKRGLS